MLGSAVCGQISMEELCYAANLIQRRNFRGFESFIVATAIYLRCPSSCAACSTGRTAVRLWRVTSAMFDFTLWDIVRNLLLALRWTICSP